MFLQETPPAGFGQSVVQKFVYYLNYPFINQAQFKVSLLSLVSLFLVIVVAWAISRYLRRFLEKRALVQHLDAGLRFTLLRIIHYLILVGGVLYGLKLGFSVDLTSVAVLLGFLSVGVGFGLQYIASDLISGLILLFERPVRVGDRLKIGDVEGCVENIALRTTMILTNDQVTVIVPNSELVRNKFINWSYRHDPVRIRLAVGADYGSDLDQVRQALLDAAANVKEVLRTPAPDVHLAGFGDSAINLELLVWINEPHQQLQIRSNVNFAIARVFRERKIEMPTPQFNLSLAAGELKLLPPPDAAVGEQPGT